MDESAPHGFLRRPEPRAIVPDFVGWEAPARYLVGYGMDSAGAWRGRVEDVTHGERCYFATMPDLVEFIDERLGGDLDDTRALHRGRRDDTESTER